MTPPGRTLGEFRSAPHEGAPINALGRYVSALKSTDLMRRSGRVSQFFGLVVESTGPDAFLGEVCEIHSRSHPLPVSAEVVGLREGKVLLMPFGELSGIGLGCEVIATGRPVEMVIGDALLGRVIDAFGRPLDGKPLPLAGRSYRLTHPPLNPLARSRIHTVLETGIKAIDGLLTLGRGQRVGIFSGSGVGKSTLLGMIARNMKADINVIGLIGERGREVLDFVSQNLGPSGLQRSVVVVATSDQPALVRSRAAYAATAIAEYFRDQQKDVMLIMDSITRYAMAQREIGLSVGEPPTARGYTPSVFAALPRLLERCGTTAGLGSITAIYSVLVEGDDLNDPIADSVRSILDGHIVLSRELAHHGHFPAIDALASTSRLAASLLTREEREAVQQVLGLLSHYFKSRDMIDIGAYRPGQNPELDRAVRLMPRVNALLRQEIAQACGRAETLRVLQAIAAER
ncbi:MAG: FliI/YscN family ATPase [Rhizobacter sp.]